MRIIHVITRLIVGGAQENTVLTCEGLAAREHDVFLFAGPTTGPEGSLVDRARGGIYEYEEFPQLVRAVRPMSDWRALRALRRRFEGIRPDVVHTHSSKAGILGRLAAYQAGVPTIVHTIHGMSFNRTQSWPVRTAFAAAERFCANRCQAIISVADEMTRQSLAAGVGRSEQFVTIRSGMAVSEFNPDRFVAAESRSVFKIPERADRIYVGTIARLFRNKGYEELMAIMQRALVVEPRVHFVWVGDGADRCHYKSELRRRGLNDQVTLTGLIPPEEIPRLLAGIDILLHTSRWEGLPRAVVQALLMKKPAVSFAIDGAPEVIASGETGFTLPLDDFEGMAGAVVELSRDADLRKKMGTEGRARCLKEFDHKCMVDSIEHLYLQLQEITR